MAIEIQNWIWIESGIREINGTLSEIEAKRRSEEKRWIEENRRTTIWERKEECWDGGWDQ